MCDAVYKGNAEQSYSGKIHYYLIYLECNDFMGGILKKGLYSANVAYWDNMRSMATDFNNSARDNRAINTILNSDRLISNEKLKDVYFAKSY